MKRLTDQSYWDTVHLGGGPASQTRSPFRQWLRYIGRSYSTEHFWKVLVRYLQPGPLDVLEIGSAPGESLREFHARFGYEPYGVEYSPIGVRVNRENFKLWGLDPKNIFESDVFADEFQSRHRDRFDVTMSRGVIEHFTDLQPVIDAHVNLLKPGGRLIVSIPNYSGLNYALGLLTVRALYPKHNLSIMRLKVFRGIFERPDLEPLFCGYEGGFDLGLLETEVQTAMTKRVLKVARTVQWGLNVLFNSICLGHAPESRYTSPHLLYIGRKRPR
jgi:SAM-dependent methyltransferase